MFRLGDLVRVVYPRPVGGGEPFLAIDQHTMIWSTLANVDSRGTLNDGYLPTETLAFTVSDVQCVNVSYVKEYRQRDKFWYGYDGTVETKCKTFSAESQDYHTLYGQTRRDFVKIVTARNISWILANCLTLA